MWSNTKSPFFGFCYFLCAYSVPFQLRQRLSFQTAAPRRTAPITTANRYSKTPTWSAAIAEPRNSRSPDAAPRRPPYLGQRCPPHLPEARRSFRPSGTMWRWVWVRCAGFPCDGGGPLSFGKLCRIGRKRMAWSQCVCGNGWWGCWTDWRPCRIQCTCGASRLEERIKLIN